LLPILAAGALICPTVQGQEIPAATPAISFPGKKCRADEDLFKAIRVTKGEAGIRVDYRFVARDEPRWANMNAALLRKFNIRAGATFCMPRDTGAADDAAVDYD
jgi:hypothetical protein